MNFGPPLGVGPMAVYPYSDGLLASLAYVSKYGDLVSLGVRQGDYLLVPRALASPGGVDHRTDGNYTWPLPAPSLLPRNQDQAQVIGKSIGLLKQGKDHLIEAPTGFGKSFVGVAIALAMCKTTLIVVTKQDLMSSWRQTLINSPTAEKPGFGLPPEQIGTVQGPILDWKDKRFVVAMIHTLVRPGKMPPEFWQYFGLGIMDECHRLGADTFQQVCSMLYARHRLGLSATPTRSDGKDRTFHYHIGPVLVKGSQIPMVPKILVKETSWFMPKGLSWSPSQMGSVFNVMVKNTQRNLLIVEFVLSSLEAGRRTVVMSDSLDHLERLFRLLCEAKVPGENIGFYVGQSTSNKLKAKTSLEAAAGKVVVLATYGMTKEGTDYPEWDTLVLATPKSDAKQAIGRIMRSKAEKKQPVVLDLIDSDKVYRNFHLSRLKGYYSVGATIVKV